MRSKLIPFMMINIYTFAKTHIVLSISMLFLFFAPPLYAKYNYSLETTNIIRDTQLLLSLNGAYTGPIDGLCNPQTRQAINESTLARTRRDKSFEIACDIASLEAINNDLRSTLIAANASITDSTATDNANSVNGTISPPSVSIELDDIKARIRNTNAALKGITDGLAANFQNQYNGLASTGMTIFVTGISVTIAIIALVSSILRDFIAKSVDASHEKFLEECSRMLQQAQTRVLDQSNTTLQTAQTTFLQLAQQASDAMLQQAKNEVSKTADIAHAALLTQIYGRLGGQIIYLYIELKPNVVYHRNLYTSYIRIGANIARLGNDAANKLIDLYKQEHKITDYDKQYIIFCKNNFVFYVSSSNDKNYPVDTKENDITDVRLCIADLEKIASELETIGDQDDGNNYLLDIKDTMVWAKLSLGIISSQQAKEEIELLIKR